jgi:histidine triad (HIT) family protein
MTQDCLFCRIYRGEIPSDILYHDDLAFAIRDIAPRAPVHLLVIPTRHFVLADDLDASSEALVGHLFTVGREMARREGIATSGYRLAMNQGDHAGQTVDHLHVHVIGGRPLGREG